MKIDVPAGNPSQYKGWFAIQEIADPFRFSYQMISSVSQPVQSGPTMQKVMGVNRLMVENNLIELATGTAASAAIQVDDGGTPGQAAPLPDYVHGEVVIRGNKIRYLDGLFDTAYTGYGIEVNGTKYLTVKDNLVDSAVTHPIRNSRCGSATYFNNTTPAGLLIQGWNQDLSRAYDELKTQVEDAFLLAYMEQG